MRNLVLLSTLSLFIGASSAPATPEVRKGIPTYVIQGPIGNGNIVPIGEQMMTAVENGETEAQLILNSPGGSVGTGFQFLALMEAARAKGLRITCFVPNLAASMAFQILIRCDERHTLNSAFLLWHRARVNVGGILGAPLTGPEAEVLAKDLKAIDEAIYSELSNTLGKHMPDSELRYHFEVETLHVGRNLHALAPGFITTHAYIPGLLEAVRDAKAGDDSDVMDYKHMEIIYITDKVK